MSMADVDITQVLEMSPAVMREWAVRVSQGNEITGLQLRNEILPDGTELGPNGQVWERHKLGSHRTVTVHCGETVYTQTFIKRDDGWSEVEEGQEST